MHRLERPLLTFLSVVVHHSEQAVAALSQWTGSWLVSLVGGERSCPLRRLESTALLELRL